MPKLTKITAEPKGKSFHYKPRPEPGKTTCPACGKGHTKTVWEGSRLVLATCTRCDWQCPKPKKPKKKQHRGIPKQNRFQLHERKPFDGKREKIERKPVLTNRYRKLLVRLLKEGEPGFMKWAARDSLAREVATKIGVSFPKKERKMSAQT